METDRQTDRHNEAIVPFLNFANAPKNHPHNFAYGNIHCSVLKCIKDINTPCGQNVEFLSAKPGGAYSNHWALKG